MEKITMKKAVKGALLSGLVFPGLGQIALKQYPRGLAFMAVALACTIYIVETTVQEVMSSLATLDPTRIASLPTPPTDHAGPALWILCLAWVWAVLDAYRVGARLDRQG
jgi:hypothetical protein